MAIFVKHSRPRALLDDIREQIQNGDLRTWHCEEGELCVRYWHRTRSRQWEDRAFILPIARRGEAAFYVQRAERSRYSRALFAATQGRFLTALLSYLRLESEIRVTPRPSGQDDPFDLD